ncbi:MAG: cysteine--tRNA ligase [Patescibacteria group bacterium]|nr:cysteine--tRNA ligase [Patescibacteria group bacterium]
MDDYSSQTMDIKIYNTLSGKIETFKPISPGKVGMYHCGPTVYDRAHIGNLRAYVFADTLRRMLEYNGYTVKQVINITDVGHLSGDVDEGEDKMSKALRRENQPLSLQAMKQVGSKYTDIFVHDLDLLNIKRPSNMPCASDYIDADIAFITRLIERGYAYIARNGIAFDTSKYAQYGKLGNIDIKGQREGARIDMDPEKKNITDFWLWKFDQNIGWESPWGRGFPGWHIECSVMSREFLGQPFDIHTGGIDHVPVHHNNEIAQSECAYDEPLAHFWMHNDFLVINQGRMGKSEGNALTLDELERRGIMPISYRYWLLTANYRKPIDFSFEAIGSAQNALIRLYEILQSYPEGGKVVAELRNRFISRINDNLDMPGAIALVWEVVKDANMNSADKKATILDFDKVLGIGLDKVIFDNDIPDNVHDLADTREKARNDKDWRKADAIRDQIEALGYNIKDNDNGYTLSKRSFTPTQ